MFARLYPLLSMATAERDKALAFRSSQSSVAIAHTCLFIYATAS